MSKTDREKAKEIYIESNGTKALVEIAEELGRPPGTVRGWKSKDDWDSFLSGTFREKAERSKVERNTKTKEEKAREKKVKKETKAIVENSNLTEKQKLFCMYYIKDFNATKAYQNAYECDYMTANASGSRLLANVSVKKEIERLTEVVVKDSLITSQLLSRRLLEELVKIAFADINDYVIFGVKEVEVEPGVYVEVDYVSLRDSYQVDGSIISEVSKGKDGVKVKLLDKIRAIDMLIKNYATLEDKDLGMEKEMFKVKLDKEKAQVEKINAEINKITGNNSEIEDLSSLRELILNAED